MTEREARMHETPDGPSGARPELPLVDLGRGFDLLEGVRVLDLTTSIAGPYATMLLADMGADVIKVERPGQGDDTRSWGPPFLEGESLWFLSVNRNKRSISFDIRSEDGRRLLEELVAQSDVIVVNNPPGTAKKIGTDAATITAIKPDIIYVSITGFGLEGARSDWTCYDLIAEGYSGIMDLTGEPETAPQKVGAPAADMLAGQDAAMGAISALLSRQRTGKGRIIDVALVESMTRFLSCRLVPYLGSGTPITRTGGKDSVIAIYQTFETADEPMTLALGNDAIWQRFWVALGKPAIGKDARYATNELRAANRPEIVQMIQDILRTRARGDWLALFSAARVPAGPINRVDQLAADGEFLDRRLLFRIREGDREVPQVGTGFRVDGQPNRPNRMPPMLGSGTDEILREVLGYTPSRIDALRRKGAI